MTFNVQAELDKLIAKNPQVLEYVEWVKYIPQGSKEPEGTTHVLTLSSQKTHGDAFVGVKVKPLYALMADALLAVF